MYGVHKGVSRAAVHPSDLALACLYYFTENLEQSTVKTALGEARSELLNRTGH